MNYLRLPFRQPRESDDKLPDVARPADLVGHSISVTDTLPIPAASSEQTAVGVVTGAAHSLAGISESSTAVEPQGVRKPRSNESSRRAQVAEEDVSHKKVIGDADLKSDASARLSAYGSKEGALISRRNSGEQQTEEQGSKAKRWEDWREFTKQHGNVIMLRIRADEIRRRARIKRRDLMRLVRAAETSAQTTLLEQADELEALEAQLDDMDRELVGAEARIDDMLPRILGSEAEETFEVLEEHGFHMQGDESQSTISEKFDPEEDMEQPPEHARLLMKLTQIDFIEEQLMELRDDKQQLRSRVESELTPEELSVLDTYEVRKAQLRAQLQDARVELEDLRNVLQPRSSLEGDASRPQPLEVLASLPKAEQQPDQVDQWLQGFLYPTPGFS